MSRPPPSLKPLALKDQKNGSYGSGPYFLTASLGMASTFILGGHRTPQLFQALGGIAHLISGASKLCVLALGYLETIYSSLCFLSFLRSDEQRLLL